MKAINFIVLLLIVIGAINWGLWGVFQFDFIAWAFNGSESWLSRLIYTLIGIAGLWSITFFCKCRAICCKSCCPYKDCKACQEKQCEKK